MEVKGWLILGAHPQRSMLSPVEPPLRFDGHIPDAEMFQQGTAAEWIPFPGAVPLTVVVVRLPIAPGLM